MGARPTPQGAPSWLVATSWVFWPPSEASWVSSGPKITPVNFYPIWTPFDIDFLKSPKTGKKQELTLGAELIG